MKIASLEDSFPRGTVMGKQITGPLLREADHFKRCQFCGGHIDILDLAWVEDHEGPFPHPGTGRAQ
jgi:hypothetical protein